MSHIASPSILERLSIIHALLVLGNHDANAEKLHELAANVYIVKELARTSSWAQEDLTRVRTISDEGLSHPTLSSTFSKEAQDLVNYSDEKVRQSCIRDARTRLEALGDRLTALAKELGIGASMKEGAVAKMWQRVRLGLDEVYEAMEKREVYLRAGPVDQVLIDLGLEAGEENLEEEGKMRLLARVQDITRRIAVLRELLRPVGKEQEMTDEQVQTAAEEKSDLMRERSLIEELLARVARREWE